eukprot:TRINITY_DN1567_c0_g1_i1.p1 TRINITY_DN1567_c0_g1~~TRINITY_DN1567_c0_g1_i1.p1  ORF type:complete len:330 (-),score=57.16 TRINITY_DN1567_c0_g1_i1:113-1048(-)
MAENAFKQAMTRNGLPKFGGLPGMNPAAALGMVGFTAAAVGVSALAYNSIYTVSGGEKAIIYSRWDGVHDEVYGEGWHFRVPWLHQPEIFNVRTRATTIPSLTASKDLQMVNITLRVLTKPQWTKLPKLFKRVGHEYDQKVWPSVVNEVLKGVVARFNAGQLVSMRDDVSKLIRQRLQERASEFYQDMEDVSITHLSFGAQYTAAVEAKQVAAQEAERARYIVEKAQQDKRSIVIKAEGDAQSAKMISDAIRSNPYFLELRRIEAARSIASVMAHSGNKLYLSSDNLMFSMLSTLGATAESKAVAEAQTKH